MLVAVATAYIIWMLFYHIFTRHSRLDGGIGVLGGLFVCSHPSANFIDMLFLGRHSGQIPLHTGEWIVWIGHNIVVFLLGVLMITVGTMQFV